MLKRPAVILLVVFAIAGTVALVRTHFRRRQLTESAKSVEPDAMAAKYHFGPPPCLRYPRSLDDAPQAEFDETAKRLDAVGLSSDQLADLVGHFITEHTKRELSAHAASSVDEYLEQLEQQQREPLSKVAFWVQREFLRAKLAKLVDGANDTLRNLEAEGAVVWASLTPEQRTTLQAIDAETPLHFEVAGVLPVLKPLKVATTRRRAKAIVELAREAKAKRPEFPVRLEDLSLPQPQRLDAWGNEFVLSAATSVIEVRSEGEDDQRDDDDVIETLDGAVDPSAAPARGDEAAPCEAPTGRTVLLQRSIASDAEVLGRGVRVAPAFADGDLTGFRVSSIRKASEAEKLGLCDGDVVRAIDGTPLASPEKVLELHVAALKRGRTALTIERGGVSFVLNVELRD
ncbi:MAG: hypothetical protein Q8S33_19790 [Myxococcales bacterium]|nr:hypothetical protein [Myxococcales bacterium]